MIRSKLQALLTRRFWAPITWALFLMATGAYLFALYLAAKESAPFADPLARKVQLIWFGLWFLWLVTSPREAQGPEIKEPSPARIGTGIVLACGVGAAIFLARGATWPNGFLLPAAVLLATAVVAVFVYRFASAHADEIGEARFDTVVTPRQSD